MQGYAGPQPGRFEPPPWPPRADPQPAMTARGAMPEAPRQVVQPVVAAPKLMTVPTPAPEEVGIIPVAKAAPAKDVRIPSPQEVGVAAPARSASAKVDWNVTRDRLERLGAISVQTIRLEEGRHRVTFLLRTNQPDRVQHIEATAGTEAEAVAVALERAEQWASAGQ
jgi:hypothetical protein